MGTAASKVIRVFFPRSTKQSLTPKVFLPPFLREDRAQANKCLLCPQIFAVCYGANITRGGFIPYVQRHFDLVVGTLYILKLLGNEN